MNRRLLPPALLLLIAGPALAQENPHDPSNPEDPVMAIARKISKALRENEEALTKLSRGEAADPKAVDLTLPPKGASAHTGTGT